MAKQHLARWKDEGGYLCKAKNMDALVKEYYDSYGRLYLDISEYRDAVYLLFELDNNDFCAKCLMREFIIGSEGYWDTDVSDIFKEIK